jgi:hypothetical protein
MPYAELNNQRIEILESLTLGSNWPHKAKVQMPYGLFSITAYYIGNEDSNELCDIEFDGNRSKAFQDDFLQIVAPAAVRNLK